jgi:hypothetical protein
MSDVPFQNKNSSMSRLQPGFMDWRKKTNKNISRGMRDMYRAKKADEEGKSLAEAVTKRKYAEDDAKAGAQRRSLEGWTPAGMIGKALGLRD